MGISKSGMWTIAVLGCIREISEEQEVKAPVTKRQISEQLKIGEDYIEQLLKPVLAVGIIKSVRGRNGGFEIVNKDATLLDVVLCSRLGPESVQYMRVPQKLRALDADLQTTADEMLSCMKLSEFESA